MHNISSKIRMISVVNPVRHVIPTIMLAWFAMSACTDASLGPPTDNLESLYWELRANHPAVLLSTAHPFDTLQLTVDPFGPDGKPFVPVVQNVATPEQTVWMSSDPLAVTVSETGLITARGVTDGITVSASRTIGEKTHTVEVFVRVTDETHPPVLTTFSVQPTDSFKRAARNFFPYSFPVVAEDVDGNSMGEIPISWQSSNPKVARFESSFFGAGFIVLTPLTPRVVIIARTMVYGVAKVDSFTLEVGWPLGDFFITPILATEVLQMGTTNGQSIFAPSVRKTELGPGGQVLFTNNSGFGPKNAQGVPARAGSTIDIIFDDPSAALAIPLFPGDESSVGGNILGLPSDTTLSPSDRQISRRFIKRGKHDFTIQPFGVRGSIYVQER